MLRGSAELVELAWNGGELLVRLGGQTLGAGLADERVARACRELPAAIVAEAESQISSALRSASVLSGRSWGRTKPEALVRVFLNASAEVRARRLELELSALEDRDEKDRLEGRLLAPDICAIELDSSGRTIEEMVEQLATLVDTQSGTRDGSSLQQG
jgi:cytidylate kinase